MITQTCPCQAYDHPTLDEVKQWYLQYILEHYTGDKVRTAEVLGVNLSTVYRMLPPGRSRPEGKTHG